MVGATGIEPVTPSMSTAKPTTAQLSLPAHLSVSVSGKYKTITEQIAEINKEMSDLHNLVVDPQTALGDDVQAKTSGYCIAFRRLKNFVSLELRIQSKKLLVSLEVDPETATSALGFTRYICGIGHFGTYDLEITIHNAADIEKAKPLLDRAYDGGYAYSRWVLGLCGCINSLDAAKFALSRHTFCSWEQICEAG